MLKWSPEPFDVHDSAIVSAAVSSDDFQSTAVGNGEPNQGHDAREFRREAGFSDSKALMNALTQEERAQVYELVEIDLAEEYQAREKEQAATYASDLQAHKDETARMVAGWTERLAAAMAAEMTDAASAAARLSVQLAEKIVRQTVAVDHQVLARVLETTLFKIPDASPLSIRTSPEDATWLESQPSLQEHLNIAHIVADRRVESGGCVIQSEGREWDATLARQLNTLEEVVSEMIKTTVADPSDLTEAAGAVAESPNAVPTESEVADVPGVE